MQHVSTSVTFNNWCIFARFDVLIMCRVVVCIINKFCEYQGEIYKEIL